MDQLRILNGRLSAALDFIRRRKNFAPDECREIITVAEALEERGEPFTRAEVKLLDVGERMALHFKSPTRPRPPSPFDERIVQTEHALADETLRYEGALLELEASRAAADTAAQKLLLASRAQDARSTDAAEGELDTARERTSQAEADLVNADRAWLRQRSRLTSLEMLRSRWHAEQEARFVGPGGKIMTAAELSKAVHRR